MAEKNYRLWLSYPQHPSLNFKRLAGSGHRLSVRVGEHYRAIGWKLEDGGVEWIWIGTHADYDQDVETVSGEAHKNLKTTQLLTTNNQCKVHL